MFVVYEIVCRELHLPVAHFDSRDEAERYIVEDCCDYPDADPADYCVEFSEEIPDYESI